MTESDLPEALGEVRDLVRSYLAGTADSFEAVRVLLNRLLTLTVMDDRDHLRFTSIQGQRATRRTIGTPSLPVRLNDGRYLRLVISLSLDWDDTAAIHKLRVYSASFQYQETADDETWIFRYDYLRVPADPHPASHLQIRGSLAEHRCLPEDTPLERIHFPTSRMTLEAIIRLLAEQFRVACNEPPPIWRPILAASEREFEKTAHRPISGPDK